MSEEMPFLPPGREIGYVGSGDIFLCAAREHAEKFSLDSTFPTGAVLVKNREIIGRGANGSKFHENFGCPRKWLGARTGKGYWMCPGCHPSTHAEQRAIGNARENGVLPKGADLYLWGHFWCCESCWGRMIDAEIANVFLAENAFGLFGNRKK